jgi:hypothetical protein
MIVFTIEGARKNNVIKEELETNTEIVRKILCEKDL